MINYKEAKKILLKSKIKIKDEIIVSSKSLNRINVLDIYSAVNYPAGTNAAFDGFAINSKDTIKLNKNNSQNFKILKTISAGDNPSLKKINKFEGVEVIGVTSGASVPEILVNDLLKYLDEHGYSDVEEVRSSEETLLFALPKELRADLKAAK